MDATTAATPWSTARRGCGPEVDAVATVAKALAHPVRVLILTQLADGKAWMAHDLAADCDLAQSTISEHLRMLRDAGLIHAVRDGARIWYSLERQALHRFVAAVDRLG